MEQAIGETTGLDSWQTSGQKREAEGEVETNQAKAQGYVEATKDRVVGAVQNMVGSATGDTSQEVSGGYLVPHTHLPLLTIDVRLGEARNEKGKVQQEANKP